MEIGKDSATSAESALRSRAEEQLASHSVKNHHPQTALDSKRLLHELQVHQIELEMQNAELRNARNETENILEWYADLYDFAPVGYFTLDRTGIISAVNLAGATLIGGVRSRLVGQFFGQFVSESDRQAFTDFLNTVLESRIKASCELTLQNSDKMPIIVQIEAMATASGLEYRLALFDITRRKNMEEQLQLKQKMESVGLLAGEIAHDFSSILNAIIDYGSFMKQNLSGSDPLQETLDHIIAAADKGADLTGRLIDFSRKQPVKTFTVDINTMIRKVENFIEMIIGDEIRLEIACPMTALNVTADSSQLEQVLINLATNSRHAMPDGGGLLIRTEIVTIDQVFIKNNGFGALGQFAVISVSDTGTGMSRETIQRIFEPFFTTDTHAKGAGLGLSIVYSIIRQHHGFIKVRSKQSKGTTFRLYLPLTDTEHGIATDYTIAPSHMKGETNE